MVKQICLSASLLTLGNTVPIFANAKLPLYSI